MKKRIAVHIERLVLKGVRPEDRDAVATSLEHELGRLLSARPGDGPGAALADRPATPATSGPGRIGRAAARAVAERVRGR